MRCPRLSRALLAALFLAAGLAVAPPTPSPFEGTWKVTFPSQSFDVTLWLVRIDKGAKKARLISGLQEYAKTQLGDIESSGERLALTLTAGTNRFHLSVVPSAKEKDELFGSLRIGSNIMPVWLRRTTLEELTQENAVRETPGFADLQKARKLADPDERLAAIRAVAAKHKGLPIHFLSLQAILGQLISQKADTGPFREIAETYRKLAARHGADMLVGANLDLARFLMGYPKAVPVAIDSTREAVKALRPDQSVALKINVQITLAAALQAAGKSDETKPVAQELDRLAAAFIKEANKSPDAQLNATGQMAVTFLSSPAVPVAEVGLEYARKAVKILRKDMPADIRLGTHKLLTQALVARGRADEAKGLRPALEKLEDEVDRMYLRQSIPFDVKPIATRKGKDRRVVLAELFTGSQYRQALAASIAFDAALKTYKPTDVVLLQYHLAFPDPDVLVNADCEARKAFYKSDLESSDRGVPAAFIDGKLAPALGGAARQRGENSYEVLREQIGKALDAAPTAAIDLSVSRKGNTVTAKATVSGSKETGSHVRLRFALVEERVRYQGASGVRLHHHVVRGFIGGAEGFKLEKKDTTQTASISLPQLRKSLEDYLTGLAKKAGAQWPERPLELARLKVIAFVQDEDGKQVFQAAQADVPAS